MKQGKKESSSPNIKKNPTFDLVGFDTPLTLPQMTAHIGFIHDLLLSETPEDLTDRLLKILADLGFSDFSFVGFSYNYKPHVYLSSLPKELLSSYQNMNCYRDDMVLDYVKTKNPAHFHHSDIQDLIERAEFPTLTFDKNIEILALYKQFEFNNIYLMPYKHNDDDEEYVILGNRFNKNKKPNPGENLRKNGILFSILAKGVSAKDFVELSKPLNAVLHLLGDTTIRIYESRFHNHNPLPKVNPKSMRLLTAMAKSDLSLSQAADKLCISVDTANKHMAMAKQMFGARSQVNAVYMAVKQGLIDY